jgi:nucleoside-diphosphate-sugar epimerase
MTTSAPTPTPESSAQHRWLVASDDCILVTGAAGFIGSRVVATLLRLGFRHIRCIARISSNVSRLEAIAAAAPPGAAVEIVRGNLLSPADCAAVTAGVSVILHLAAARGEKSVADAVMNSVVTTRNLLEAARARPGLRRFVNVSSFAVYANADRQFGQPLDEHCPVEPDPASRGDAYSFAKLRQDRLVEQYGRDYGVPYVIVRPGYVYGPGNEPITGRVGIGSFGVFLHLGGANTLPLTFVDNCADAIVLAGIVAGVDGQVVNVVDDDLPSSRRFLRLYKRHVKRFPSVYLPHGLSYLLCWMWESYSRRSEGQLPPVYNRRSWAAYWRRTRYSNQRLKTALGWSQRVSTADGLEQYFQSCRDKFQHA